MQRLLVLFALALTPAAQDSRFGVQSRLVLVPVSVTDAKGRPVDALEAKDFLLLDNGRPQIVNVDTAGTGVAPVALVIAIQTSGISKPVLEKVRRMGAMIQPLVTGERGCAAVEAFAETVVWMQECTNDNIAIANAFEQVRPGADKSARMLDAVYEGVERLRRIPNSRRVLLLISESRDRGSQKTLEEAALAIEKSDVTVYAATYSAMKTAFTTRTPATDERPNRTKLPGEEGTTRSGGAPVCGPKWCPDPQLPAPEQRVDILGGIGELARMGKTNTTRVLTTSTGGHTFPFTRLKGLEDAIEGLGLELQSQYVLSFTPDALGSGFHQLEVRVVRGGYHVRARLGYWSADAVTMGVSAPGNDAHRRP